MKFSTWIQESPTLPPMMLFILLTAVGCGPGSPVKHKISGTVTFMGKPIKEGSITFEDPTTGLADQAKLQDGAKYEIKLVNGNYRVSVEPLMEERTARADTPPDYVFKKADDIPARYRSGAESGLTHTVSSPGEFNVEMNSSKK